MSELWLPNTRGLSGPIGSKRTGGAKIISSNRGKGVLLLRNLYDPLVAHDHHSDSLIHAAGNVTSWNNVAEGPSAGGSAYDLAPSFGIPTVTTVQGKTVVEFIAANTTNLRPAAGQTINQPFTIALILKSDQGGGSGVRRILDGFSTVAPRIYDDGAGEWEAYANSILSVTEIDTETNIVFFRADTPNGRFSVYNTTEQTQLGDPGNRNFAAQWCTLGSHNANLAWFDGWVGGLWVWDKALSDAEITAVKSAINRDWVIDQ